MDTSSLKYCPCCMTLENIEELGVCPNCHQKLGHVENGKEDLPIYTVLENRYMIGKINENGENYNIYIGLDLTDKKTVWVKEFFYRSLVYRDQGSANIQIYAGQREAYLKKYDAFVKNHQKPKDEKGIVFANGTVYQITSLSEEEVAALCQDSVISDCKTIDQNEKRRERTVFEDKKEKRGGFVSFIFSKKLKIVVVVLATVCLVGSAFQKFNEKNDVERVSVSSEQKKEDLGLKTETEEMPMASGAAASSSPQITKAPTHIQKAGDKPKSKVTPRPKPKAKAKKKPHRPIVTEKPHKPVATKKPHKSVATKKPSNNAIDDGTVDKKVYEIK